MTNTINLHLPIQFQLTCILYQIPPQQFLEDLLNHIIIPSEQLSPNTTSLLATDYFLEYAASNHPSENTYSKQQQRFLEDKKIQYDRLLKAAAQCTMHEKTQLLKLFFEDWLQTWRKLNP